MKTCENSSNDGDRPAASDCYPTNAALILFHSIGINS